MSNVSGAYDLYYTKDQTLDPNTVGGIDITTPGAWVPFGEASRDGMRIVHQYSGQEVRSHSLGESVATLIIQGADAFLELTAQEWDRCAVQELSWQHSGMTPGAGPYLGCDAYENGIQIAAIRSTYRQYGEGNEPACRVNATGDISDVHVCSVKNPYSYWFHRASIAFNQQMAWQFNNDLRVVAMRFRIFLWDPNTVGHDKFYTVTQDVPS